jgi:hypothetical protein
MLVSTLRSPAFHGRRNAALLFCPLAGRLATSANLTICLYNLSPCAADQYFYLNEPLKAAR